MVKKATSRGRRKIEITKIEKKSHLQVTFSKRRAGLFKKASELCTLCGVEVAIIVFSPADKVFSFGHPQVDIIVDRFLVGNPVLDLGPIRLGEAVHRDSNIHGLNIELTGVLHKLENERERGEVLEETRKAGQLQYWWEAPIDKLGLKEVAILLDSLNELKKKVNKYKADLSKKDDISFIVKKPYDFSGDFTNYPVGYNFGYGDEFF